MPQILSFNFTTYKDPKLRRLFEFLRTREEDALPPEDLLRFNTIVNEMTENYGKVRICSYREPTKCDLQLEPGKSISSNGWSVIENGFYLFRYNNDTED